MSKREDVIRKLVEEGGRQADIARYLGVSRQYVGAVVHSKPRGEHDYFYYDRTNRVTCSKCGMGLDYMNKVCRGRAAFGPTHGYMADMLAADRAADLQREKTECTKS